MAIPGRSKMLIQILTHVQERDITDRVEHSLETGTSGYVSTFPSLHYEPVPRGALGLNLFSV